MKHKILTIANYPFNANFQNLIMARMWLNSVIKNTDLEIIILSLNPISQYFPQYTSRIKFICKPKKYLDPIPRYKRKFKHHHLVNHNIRYKLFHLSQINFPFIFIDLDTYIFSNLNQLIKITKSMPYVAIDQPTKNFLNSGLQIVNDPAILDWKKLLEMLYSPSFKVNTGGSDQALLWHYFNKKKYNYRHKLIGSEWNMPVYLAKFQQINYRYLTKANNKYIHIVHYLNGYKPWQINCPIFKNYRKDFFSEKTTRQKINTLSKHYLKKITKYFS